MVVEESGFLGAGSPQLMESELGNMFLLREELPSTGFNRLVKASRDGKWYVLKGLKPEVSGQYIYQRLLQKECDILQSLQHPYVVKCEGMVAVPGMGSCIVLEYIQGQSLRHWEEGSSTLPSTERFQLSVRIATQLAEAISVIHSHQIIHRDLKPENILITDNGHNVKVIDFGLSDTDSYSILKQPAGTLSYLAPEMMQQEPVCDARADIYSYGKILQELFSGVRHRKSRLYLDIADKCTLPLSLRIQHDDEIITLLAEADVYKPFWNRPLTWMVLSLSAIIIILGSISVFSPKPEQLLLPGTSIPRAEIDSITKGWQASDRNSFMLALQRFESDRKNKIAVQIAQTMEQRNAFVLAFTPDSILRMTAEDYSIENPQGFCRRLLFEMPMLGGGTERYTSTIFNEFSHACCHEIVRAISAYRSGRDYVLESSPLSSFLHKRLLSVYFPDRYLPIIDQQQANYICQTMIPDPEVRQALRPEGTRDSRDILLALRRHYPSLNQWTLAEYAWFLLHYYPNLESPRP